MIPAPVQNILDRLVVAWHERAIALKATSFALIGVLNTAVDFSVFWMAANFLQWPLVLANVVAWLIAVTFSYAMNSIITFGPESGRILRWRDYGCRNGHEHGNLARVVLFHSGPDGEAGIDPGQLRGEFLTFALCRVPRTSTAPKRRAIMHDTDESIHAAQ